jgi:signal peptidase II
MHEDPAAGDALPSAGRGALSRAQSSLWLWLGIALLVIALDQASKQMVSNAMHYMETRTITGFLDLVLYYNTGAAFSMLADAQGWQRGFFIAIGAAASVVIVMLLKKHVADARFCLALALILGGALGNVWDRVLLGHVIDFIQVHAGAHYWPAFNVADSAICCGAGLLLWDGIFGGARKSAGS